MSVITISDSEQYENANTSNYGSFEKPLLQTHKAFSFIARYL